MWQGSSRRSSLDLPAGDIKTKGGEILLRTKEKKYRGTEYAEIAAVAKTDGTIVRLGDIAKIRDGFEDTDMCAEFDGKTFCNGQKCSELEHKHQKQFHG